MTMLICKPNKTVPGLFELGTNLETAKHFTLPLG